MVRSLIRPTCFSASLMTGPLASRSRVRSRSKNAASRPIRPNPVLGPVAHIERDEPEGRSDLCWKKTRDRPGGWPVPLIARAEIPGGRTFDTRRLAWVIFARIDQSVQQLFLIGAIMFGDG